MPADVDLVETRFREGEVSAAGTERDQNDERPERFAPAVCPRLPCRLPVDPPPRWRRGQKEAIAHAYAAAATAQLHRVYDAVLAPEVIDLPLAAFLDAFVDALIAFNRESPGYLALSVASTVSPSLALALADLRQGIAGRLDALIAAVSPRSTPEERRLRGLVSYHLVLALLPLVLGGDGEDERAIARELKTVFYRYWDPNAGTRPAPESPTPPPGETR